MLVLLSDFLYKVGRGRAFVELSKELLASILEEVHLSLNPECSENVEGGHSQSVLVGVYTGTRSTWTHDSEA